MSEYLSVKMGRNSIKEDLIAAMKEGEFLELVRAQVKEAVAEAVAAKDEEIRELREELDDTKVRLNELEQYSRRLCLSVSGVPESANESTNRLVTDLAKMAGVDVAPTDIDTSHRVGAQRPGKVRSIIVRFTNFTARQTVYNARKELRKPRPFKGSTVSAQTAGDIFVSDNLTRENQQILYRARQFKRDKKISAAWSDVGKLKVRVSQGGPTHIIRSMQDLTKLVGPETPAAAATAAAAASEGGPRRPRETRTR